MDEPSPFMTVNLILMTPEYGQPIVDFEIRGDFRYIYSIPELDKLRVALAFRRLARMFEDQLPFGQVAVTPEKPHV